MIDISKAWSDLKAVEKLGEGSFGRVYKCEREEFGIKSVCAVKVISIPQSQAEIESMSFEGVSAEGAKTYYSDVVSDFANEIKLMEMLKGAPNIVNVENFRIIERENEIGWDIYIRMEYLQSFVSYSKNKKFTEEEVKKFALDISNALAICSKNGIIHRDIKPDNIFIDKFGSFKLGDFGVARRLEGTMSVMSKKGTYSYMAPEVFKGEKYDCRADIYSLGMVMYKLLNRNRDPFLDVNSELVSFKDRNEAIERRRSGERLPAPVDASPSMAAVILKACEYRPENRYSSVEEFREALNKLNAPVAFAEEPTVASRDYFERTVAARDIELPAPISAQADFDDTTVVVKTPIAEESTVIMGEEATVVADEATIVADEEPTVLNSSNDVTVVADDEATVVADDSDATLLADDKEAADESDPNATLIADAPYDEPSKEENEDDGKEEKPTSEKKKKTLLIILSVLGVIAAVIAAIVLFESGVLDSSSTSEYYDDSADYYEEDYGYYEEETVAADSWVTEFATEIATERVTEHIVTEGEKLYIEADNALKNGDIEKAAILFGKSANYNYSDSRERSIKLWERIKSDFDYNISEINVYSDGITVTSYYDYTFTFYTDRADEWNDVIAADLNETDEYVVGLKLDGTVIAVGDNSYNQCDVALWNDVVAISVGAYHTIALKSDGTVLAIGWDESDDRCDTTPCQVAELTDVVYIDASWWCSIAEDSNGNEYLFGYPAGG